MSEQPHMVCSPTSYPVSRPPFPVSRPPFPMQYRSPPYSCYGGKNVINFLLKSSKHYKTKKCTAMKLPFMYSFLGIALPQSQFPHSCVCWRFIYSQDRSTYFPAAELADRSWKYINLSHIYEYRNWEPEHYNSVLEITV